MSQFNRLFALLVLGVMPIHLYADQVFDPVPPSQFPTLNTQEISSSSEDKLYMLESGDTAVSIAERFTGDRKNWASILRYNSLQSAADLKKVSHVVLPASLLINKAPVTTTYEIADATASSGTNNLEDKIGTKLNQSLPASFDVQESVLATEQLVQENSINYLPTEYKSLFVGEISMLGRVNVSRVAVGNGAIIRAEVLKTGELMIIAKSPGSTSLRLWHHDNTQSDYNIRVNENDQETRFPMQRMVRMKVRMVEFRKSALSELGVDWSSSIDGPTFATAGDLIGNDLYRPSSGSIANLPNSVKPFSTYFGIASNITSRINLLTSSGDAITLAEPVLSCANGGEAKFLAGGEIPYPTTDSNGNSRVEFKEYGVRLAIAPQIDASGNVSAAIETEISQVDPAVSVQGAPGLLTRKAETLVNVRSGQTIVISGLLSNENGMDESGISGLSNLPILGALFKSKRFRNAVSELVIFVTPEVIEPENFLLSKEKQQLFTRSENRVKEARRAINLME